MAPDMSDNLTLPDIIPQPLGLWRVFLRRALRLGAGFLLVAIMAGVTVTTFSPAARADSTSQTDQIRRGPVTNLPLPRFVSMKAGKGNARRGPSLNQKVDWVFKRANMPLRVTAEYGHWRRVEDWEGEGGWMHYTLLSGVRMVLVVQDLVALHNGPQTTAPVVARAEAGVIAHLGACKPRWCRIRMSGYRGWVPKSALWGVGPEELRD